MFIRRILMIIDTQVQWNFQPYRLTQIIIEYDSIIYVNKNCIYDCL